MEVKLQVSNVVHIMNVPIMFIGSKICNPALQKTVYKMRAFVEQKPIGDRILLVGNYIYTHIC